MFDANSPLVMNPLIFYRVTRPAKDISKLPLIKLDKFYEQSAADEEQICFTVKNIKLGSKEAKNYLPHISNKETLENF